MGTVFYAIVTGVALTAIRIPYRDYRFQFSWAPVASLFGYLGCLILGAAGGALGKVVATAVNWEPTVKPWLSGIVFGALGTALVRADFSDLPKPELGPAISAFGAVANWLSGLVDTEREKRIPEWLDSLENPLLGKYVVGLLDRRYARDGQVPEVDRTRAATEVYAAITVLDPQGGADAPTQVVARSRLVAYGEEWVIRYKAYRSKVK